MGKSLRFAALVALFFSTVLAANVFQVNCTTTPDKYGFVELKARAGVQTDGFLDCEDVSVRASIKGFSYSLYKQYSCDFIRLVQLPEGLFNASFNASFPDNTTQAASCLLNVTQTPVVRLDVYGIKNDTSYKAGSTLALKAVLVIAGENAEANITAVLWKEGALSTAQFSKDALGMYQADLALNAPAEVNYYVNITARSGLITAEKQFLIFLSENETVDAKRLIVSSPEERLYTENYSVPFIAEYRDENNFIIMGASVNVSLYRQAEFFEEFSLQEAKWYYQATRLLSPGEYSAVFQARKDNFSSTASRTFFVGTPYSLSQAVNFSVKLVSPTSGVYAENAVIEVRARVTKADAPVKDANVTLVFDGTSVAMSYDAFGEYVASIGPLAEKEYEATATARTANLIAEDRVTFLITKHFLKFVNITPADGAKLTLKRGAAVKVAAFVLTEEDDVAYGVLVKALVKAPDGKQVELQLFQDKKTGEYSSTLYLDKLDGNYSLQATASHPQFVEAKTQASFTAVFEKEELTILGYKITWETLFTILAALVIIILLAALLKAVF